MAHKSAKNKGLKYVDITGLSKERVLAVLYNGAAAYEGGILQSSIHHMLFKSNNLNGQDFEKFVKDHYPYENGTLERKVLINLIDDLDQFENGFTGLINFWRIYEPEIKMTESLAKKFIQASEETENALLFDKIYGRPLGVYLGRDSFVSNWYDRFNGGSGTAERMVESIRKAEQTQGSESVFNQEIEKNHELVSRKNEKSYYAWCKNILAKSELARVDSLKSAS